MQLMYKGRDKDAAMSRIRLIAAMDKMVSTFTWCICTPVLYY